jgi:hypothetical protein
MKKSVLLIVFLICASFTTAQKTHMYLGLGLSLPFIPGEEIVLPVVSFQVGTMIADNVELRANFDTVLLINLVGVDVLYTTPIPDSNARWYGGLGVGGLSVAFYGFAFDIRAPIGAEFFTTPEQTIGIYAEAQPNLLFSSEGSAFFINLRAGVNFHLNF